MGAKLGAKLGVKPGAKLEAKPGSKLETKPGAIFLGTILGVNAGLRHGLV